MEICKNYIDTVSNGLGVADFALEWVNGLGDLGRVINMTGSLLGRVFYWS